MSQSGVLIFQLAVLILSVVVHEVSHGLSANALGDPTAKNLGRLSFNPIRHLDFWGSFIIPLLTFLFAGFIFGWAKPVPYNPYNLRNQKWGPAMVAAAGPLSNLTIAIFFAAILRFVNPLLALPAAFLFGAAIIIFINILLAVFNLLPIPPLDGSKILAAFLPYRYERTFLALGGYGFFLLIIFIILIFPIVFPIIPWLFKVLVGQSLVSLLGGF